MPTRSLALFGAALLVLSGCVGGPSLPRAVHVADGQRTVVRLVQYPSGQVMTLQNASSGKAADVYSDPKSDRLTKVVGDAQLQALLDVFAEKNLFATAMASAPPDVRDVLVVQQQERRWVFCRQKAGLQQEELAFHEAKSYFLSVWNGATAYHSADVDRADLKAEQDRLRSGNAGKQKPPATGGQK